MAGRDILCLHVGHCGNQVGAAFWDVVAAEHGIDAEGAYTGANRDVDLARVDAYFRELAPGRYVPRAMLVDLDPTGVDTIRSGRLGRLFNPNNVVVGQHGTGNNWAKGRYTDGAELLDNAMDVVRREVEYSDMLQGNGVLAPPPFLFLTWGARLSAVAQRWRRHWQRSDGRAADQASGRGIAVLQMQQQHQHQRRLLPSTLIATCPRSPCCRRPRPTRWCSRTTLCWASTTSSRTQTP